MDYDENVMAMVNAAGSDRLKREDGVLTIDVGAGVGTVPAGAFTDDAARWLVHDEINKGPITMTVMVGLMMAAYRRGRREAIEEAARYLRAFSKEATSNGLEDTAATLDAAAEGIENHEAELRKRHAHGQ